MWLSMITMSNNKLILWKWLPKELAILYKLQDTVYMVSYVRVLLGPKSDPGEFEERNFFLNLILQISQYSVDYKMLFSFPSCLLDAA